MKIRNRIAEIKILQAHILQDYFKMALAANFIDDTWKSIFHDEVQKRVESDFSRSYVGAWEKMQIIGMDHYSIGDMDTTIITAILKNSTPSPFSCCKFYKIEQYLDYIQEDRNNDAHATGNETNSELLQRAFGSLHALSRFISAVAKSKVRMVSVDEKSAYARKYQVEIESLRLQFENDYNETLKTEEIEQSINRDAERIKSSKDPYRTYLEIYRKYINKRDKEDNNDFILFNRFMQNAADAGIVWAYSWMGDMYFEGLLTKVDYSKAAEYYEKGISQLIPRQKLNLASIYLNDLCNSSHTKEEAMTIIKSYESPRWKIFTYTSKDGYEFYSLKRNKIILKHTKFKKE